MALRDDMILLAPEFTSVDADVIARQNQFIAWAALQVNRTAFGTKADLATILLAAHMLTKMSASAEDNVGAVGAITSEKVSDIQTNYAGPDARIRPDLSSTTYGIQFWNLLNQLSLTPLCI